MAIILLLGLPNLNPESSKELGFQINKPIHVWAYIGRRWAQVHLGQKIMNSRFRYATHKQYCILYYIYTYNVT